jgi:hypothetical protein
MILAREGKTAASGKEARAFLAETARAVKVMKASWLKVAIHLRRIRAEELWRHAEPACASFEEYVYGTLQIQRAVARRMLDAVGYTELRRPELLSEFERGNADLLVPSYDVLNQLRRAEASFSGREGDLRDLESRVFEDGVGRATLQREIDAKLGHGDAPAGGPGARGGAEATTLESVVEELKAIEKKLLELKAPKEARRLLFALVELLDRRP